MRTKNPSNNELKLALLVFFSFLMFLFVIFIVYRSSQASRKTSGQNGEETGLAYKKNLVEETYPKYKNFEDQDSFAGKTVIHERKTETYYFGYVTQGSGVPFINATCFRVDANDNVAFTGYIENGMSQSINDIDLETCTFTDKALGSLFWSLPFQNEILFLDRMGSGEINGTFWQREVISVQLEQGSPLRDFVQVEERSKESDDFIYYDYNNDRYYVTDSDGFLQIRIVNAEEIDEMAGAKELIPSGGEVIEKNCKYKELNFTTSRPWLALECTYASISSENTEPTLIGISTDCYINIENTNDYIAFERQMISGGSSYDVVTAISEMGIQTAQYLEIK